MTYARYTQFYFYVAYASDSSEQRLFTPSVIIIKKSQTKVKQNKTKKGSSNIYVIPSYSTNTTTYKNTQSNKHKKPSYVTAT